MQTTIDSLKEILLKLPEDKIQAVYDFAVFLNEKEEKRRAFVNKILEAEKEPKTVFNSTEEYRLHILKQIDEIKN